MSKSLLSKPLQYFNNRTPVSANVLIVSVAVIILATGNFRFMANVLANYPPSLTNSFFFITLLIVSLCVSVILLGLLCHRFTLKPVLILILLCASSAAYFMDTYNVVIDDVMIDNIMRTDRAEVTNLVSLRQSLYIFFLGILPAIVVLRIPVRRDSIRRGLTGRVKLLGTAMALIAISLFSASTSYASFFREHKLLRFYANPTYFLYSLTSYGKDKVIAETTYELKELGTDAKIAPTTVGQQRKLSILVIGETVRADHVSLNGYPRQTTPLLAQEPVISFDNFWSCGTSTAVSVPCMFSVFDQQSFSSTQAEWTENALDILQRAGINVIWIDNNSDSKGVALRVPFANYKTDEMNPICDIECRDIGMLQGVEDFIQQHPSGDILVVLHQMGNHGPAYYRRYPAEFEKFQPVCSTNQLEQCSNEEIINTYDNALLYTDYFLSETIDTLKKHNAEFDTSMLYISDHGESLGEYNLYLHGLPYVMAPETQTHVPMIVWLESCANGSNEECSGLRGRSDEEFSHDNVFHTLLGLMDVSTSVYDESLDIFRVDGD